MGLTEKAKELADVTLRRAGELSETAREKAPDFLDKAADVTVKAVDSAAAGIDRVTGGRFHDQLESATSKVGESLDRAKPEAPTTTVEVVRPAAEPETGSSTNGEETKQSPTDDTPKP